MGAPRLSDGPAFLRDAFNDLADYVESIVPVGPHVTDSPSGKGRYIAPTPQSKGHGASRATPPLTILDAHDSTHAGRVRVLLGTLGNLLPAEMHIPDALLPDGTDNRCYLTMANGANQIIGKVAVDSTTGLFTSASIYTQTTAYTPDSAYAYLYIGGVNYDSTAGTLTISQLASGSQSLQVIFSSDGTTIQPYWNSISSL